MTGTHARAAARRSSPQAAEALRSASARLAEEARERGTRLGKPLPEMVRVEDPELAETSSAVLAWRQQLELVRGARALVRAQVERQRAGAAPGGEV